MHEDGAGPARYRQGTLDVTEGRDSAGKENGKPVPRNLFEQREVIELRGSNLQRENANGFQLPRAAQ